MMGILSFLLLVVVVAGDDKKKAKNEIDDIRLLLSAGTTTPRPKTLSMIAEITDLRSSLLKSTKNAQFSETLAKMLKSEDTPESPNVGASLNTLLDLDELSLKSLASIVSTTEKNPIDEMDLDFHALGMRLAGDRSNELINLYRENLKILSIKERTSFKIGKNVFEWKVLQVLNDVHLFGMMKSSILIMEKGDDESFWELTSVPVDVEEGAKYFMEIFRYFDAAENRAENMMVVGSGNSLTVYKVRDAPVTPSFKRTFTSAIESMLHVKQANFQFLVLVMSDDAEKFHAKFIDFNFNNGDFWISQVVNLPARPKTVTTIDMGSSVMVSFVMQDEVLIYQNRAQSGQAVKFEFLKAIAAENATTARGFRIGGQSYLAIGGSQPQILRFVDGNFEQQTHFGQSFGHVEHFLAIPIRTYRDDLVLLVQHRLNFTSHSVAVIDALIWNGIAFNVVHSVPCDVTIEPFPQGFGCIADPERFNGLKGAGFIHNKTNESFMLIVPKKNAHSGMFTVKYDIVEAEDPFLKEKEQLKKSIDDIELMLSYEEMVRKSVEEVLQGDKDPRSEFSFDNLEDIHEAQAELLEFGDGNRINEGVIEFIGSRWDSEDFANLEEVLDRLEKTLDEDEEKLRQIDEQLNTVNRINRQAQIEATKPATDSPIHFIRPAPFNGQLDLSTLHVETSEPAEELPGDHASRQRRQVNIDPIRAAEVPSLKAKNLQVELINGVKFEDLVFVDDDGILRLPDATVKFTDNVQVADVEIPNDGRVNDIDLSAEVLTVENLPSSVTFDDLFATAMEAETLNDLPIDLETLSKLDIPTELMNITLDKVDFLQNLNIKTINGIDFETFVSNLVPKHQPTRVDELEVNGNVKIFGGRGRISADRVNGLEFPEEFVLTEGKAFTLISGKKTFAQLLATQSIETDGTIDGIDPLRMITLNQRQTIPRETTFDSLEVGSKLEVNGTISGRELDKFLPNPSLAETKDVQVACQFKEIHVEGDIIIENNLNGQNLQEVLQNVVYEAPAGEKITIEGPKMFKNLNVQGNVHIDNNFINDVNLDNIMSTDREQSTTIGLFNGHVTFHDVKMSGLFDGLNASEIESRSVRTFGDQFIETELIVKRDFRVSAGKSEIKTSINQIPVQDLFFVDEPIDLSLHDVAIDNVGIKDATVEGDVFGTASSNVDFNDLRINYLRKSIPQSIAVPVQIKLLTTRGNFRAKTINELDFEVFKNYLSGIRNYKEFLLNGGVKIDNLFIDGNVTMDSINGQSFKEILENVIWLNRPNNISRLRFFDEVKVDGGKLSIGHNLNDVNFANFLSNWVPKDSESIRLKSPKIFKNHLLVEGLTRVSRINGIPFENLLMKNEVDFTNMKINGNVRVKELNVERMFNGASTVYLKEIYSYDDVNYEHVVNSDVLFHNHVKVDRLNTPFLNDANITQWMGEMIRLDDNNVQIKCDLLLHSDLTFMQGFTGEKFNDIDLEFLPKVLMTNDEKMLYITGDLKFQGDVSANLVGLQQSLFTRFISRCDPKEWYSVGIPTDKNLNIERDIHIAASSLVDEGLSARFINGIPIEAFFTLHTNQSFHNAIDLRDLKVTDRLIVNNLVSGTKIENERANTVMTYGNHTIHAPSVFFSPTVNENLNLYGRVNNITRFDDVIRLDSPATEIVTPIIFDEIESPALITNAKISGVDVDEWFEKLVWKKGKTEQRIDGHWKIDHLRVAGEVQGNGIINERSVVEIEKNLRSNLEVIESTISNYSSEYREMCSHLKKLAKDSRKSSHILKYFELDFKLKKDSPIHSFFYFGEIFGINIGCRTFLYQWMKNDENFKEIGSTETGHVDAWKVLQASGGEIFIIVKTKSRSFDGCAYSAGLNIWKFQNKHLVHFKTVLQNADDIVEMHVNLKYDDRFFTLDKNDVVKSYLINGAIKDTWPLSREYSNYSFVDLRASNDIMLSNSRKLVILESKFKSRKARTFYPIETPLLRFQKNSELVKNDNPSPPEIPVSFKNRSTPTLQPSTTTNRKSENGQFLSDIRSFSENMRNGVKKSFEEMRNKTLENLKLPPSRQVMLIRSDNLSKLRDSLKLPKLLARPKIDKIDGPELSTENLPEDITAEPELVQSEAAELQDEFTTTTTTETTPVLIDEILPNTADDDEEKENSSAPFEIIDGGGIRESENIYFPERGSGEFLMVLVGPHFRSLYVVSRVRDATIKRHQNSIIIYNDIFDDSGSVYQFIPCVDPSHLSVLEFRDETLLAFLEGRREIIVYIYRGIEGFVFFRKITLPDYASAMTSLVLPPKLDFKCDNHYLVVKIGNEVLFYRVMITGNCGVANVECDSI